MGFLYAHPHKAAARYLHATYERRSLNDAGIAAYALTVPKTDPIGSIVWRFANHRESAELQAHQIFWVFHLQITPLKRETQLKKSRRSVRSRLFGLHALATRQFYYDLDTRLTAGNPPNPNSSFSPKRFLQDDKQPLHWSRAGSSVGLSSSSNMAAPVYPQSGPR